MGVHKVYIADDNIEFANFLAAVADKEGWDVEICANGRELLEKVGAGAGPALLLVDISMPEMDGIEAIEGLIEIDRPLHLRFMTGGDDSAITAARLIAQARDLTVRRSLFKPVDRETLTRVLRDEAEAMGAVE